MVEVGLGVGALGVTEGEMVGVIVEAGDRVTDFVSLWVGVTKLGVSDALGDG